MKKLAILFLLCSFFSCSEKKEYAQIYGHIKNSKSTEFLLYGIGTKKTILLDKNGKFKDTFKIKSNGSFQIMFPKDMKMSSIYVLNGSDLRIEADINNYRESLKFEGNLADINNYFNERIQLITSKEVGFNKVWYREDRAGFNSKIKTLKSKLERLLQSYKNIKENNIQKQARANDVYIKRIETGYNDANTLSLKLKKGTVSPIFENYLNIKGGNTSLKDFKGKYVFIDVWATWCAPCKVQFPYLKEFEEKYKNKNIEFVSISVDKSEDFEKWKKMVTDLHLEGTQLYADKSFNSSFIKEYQITSIPRFILINPKGVIVDYDAPKPSNKVGLTKLFSIIN